MDSGQGRHGPPAGDDHPFIVLTETKFRKRYRPTRPGRHIQSDFRVDDVLEVVFAGHAKHSLLLSTSLYCATAHGVQCVPSAHLKPCLHKQSVCKEDPAADIAFDGHVVHEPPRIA